MTLKTLFLIIWLASGERHIEPVTDHECSEAMIALDAVRTLGLGAATEDGTHVVMAACGESAVVLALPTSDMPCEWEGA